MSYAELQVTTHFSFLRGASSPEELFVTAAELGIEALGVADQHSLAGMVRAYEAAKTTGVRLVVGCRLDLQDGPSLLVYPTDRKAYGRSLPACSRSANERAGKARVSPRLGEMSKRGSEGLLAVLLSGWSSTRRLFARN